MSARITPDEPVWHLSATNRVPGQHLNVPGNKPTSSCNSRNMASFRHQAAHEKTHKDTDNFLVT
jgi:hypothetical protein